MLDSIYHMTLKLFQNHIVGVKTSAFWHSIDKFKKRQPIRYAKNKNRLW